MAASTLEIIKKHKEIGTTLTRCIPKGNAQWELGIFFFTLIKFYTKPNSTAMYIDYVFQILSTVNPIDLIKTWGK